MPCPCNFWPCNVHVRPCEVMQSCVVALPHAGTGGSRGASDARTAAARERVSSLVRVAGSSGHPTAAASCTPSMVVALAQPCRPTRLNCTRCNDHARCTRSTHPHVLCKFHQYSPTLTTTGSQAARRLEAARPPDAVKLGSFSLLRRLGKGGYATVYAARKEDTLALYALKVVDTRRQAMPPASRDYTCHTTISYHQRHGTWPHIWPHPPPATHHPPPTTHALPTAHETTRRKAKIRHVQAEREIAARVSGAPFLCSLIYAFKAGPLLVLALPLFPGGTLQVGTQPHWPRTTHRSRAVLTYRYS